jgi:hypothetical protein
MSGTGLADIIFFHIHASNILIQFNLNWLDIIFFHIHASNILIQFNLNWLDIIFFHKFRLNYIKILDAWIWKKIMSNLILIHLLLALRCHFKTVSNTLTVKKKISGDRHWLHRKVQIQLPYEQGHNGPLEFIEKNYSRLFNLNFRFKTR